MVCWYAICADVIRKKIYKWIEKMKFELMKFRDDNICQPVLTADNVKEKGKIKML